MFEVFKTGKESTRRHQESQNETSANAEDASRTHQERSRVEKIKEICDLGRIHSKAMRDSSLEPAVLANERKNYEMYKHDAICSARRVSDAGLRDFSLSLIIDLCLDGRDYGDAKRLFHGIESNFVKHRISVKHPQLVIRT
jgi:hypothetical protein